MTDFLDIIVPGKVEPVLSIDPDSIWKGKCEKCGCEFRCGAKGLLIAGDKAVHIVFRLCPMMGCKGKPTVVETKKV